MARPELGTKRVCPTTGRKFYDLGRDPITSPYSGESWPRAAFEPIVKDAKAAAANDDDDEDAVDANAPDLVSLDEAEPAEAKDVVVEDVEVDDAIGGDDEDDTFLAEEEEGDDDVSVLIDGDIEGEEES